MAEVDLTGDTALTILVIHGNVGHQNWNTELTGIDLSTNPSLSYLAIGSCLNLSSLDLSRQTNLREAIVHHSALSCLNLSKCTKIRHVDFRWNDGATIDLSWMTFDHDTGGYLIDEDGNWYAPVDPYESLFPGQWVRFRNGMGHVVEKYQTDESGTVVHSWRELVV